QERSERRGNLRRADGKAPTAGGPVRRAIYIRKNEFARRPARSDAAFVSPSQHVKLRQHRRGKPMVCNDSAREPAQAMHEILEVGLARDGRAGPRQRRWVSDLQVYRQYWIARGRRAGKGVVGVVEHDDLEDAARLALCRL